MKVTIDQRGGVTNLQRHVEINERTITITDRGISAGSRYISAGHWRILTKFVSQLLNGKVEITKHSGFPPSDSMDLTIILEMEGKPSKTLQISSGDDATPCIVWHLLALVDHLSS